MKDYQTIAKEYISKHPYFTARKDVYETPAGKIVDPYFVVELPVSVCAMAITASNEVLMVEQYRHPIGQNILEIPGGFMDEGEDPQQAISRELLEETGYAFDNYIQLTKTAANPGVLNNFTYLFLATGGKKVADQSLDPNEEIKLLLKPLDEVRTLLKHNKIVQAMHALCLFYGFEYLDTNKG